MRKWITYILTIYILVCTVVPCCMFDNCENETNIEQTSQQQQDNECNSCTPFSICSSSQGFVLSPVHTAIAPAAFTESPVYSHYHFSSKSDYFSTLFQPPRLG